MRRAPPLLRFFPPLALLPLLLVLQTWLPLLCAFPPLASPSRCLRCAQDIGGSSGSHRRGLVALLSMCAAERSCPRAPGCHPPTSAPNPNPNPNPNHNASATHSPSLSLLPDSWAVPGTQVVLREDAGRQLVHVEVYRYDPKP